MSSSERKVGAPQQLNKESPIPIKYQIKLVIDGIKDDHDKLAMLLQLAEELKDDKQNPLVGVLKKENKKWIHSVIAAYNENVEYNKTVKDPEKKRNVLDTRLKSQMLQFVIQQRDLLDMDLEEMVAKVDVDKVSQVINGIQQKIKGPPLLSAEDAKICQAHVEILQRCRDQIAKRLEKKDQPAYLFLNTKAMHDMFKIIRMHEKNEPLTLTEQKQEDPAVTVQGFMMSQDKKGNLIPIYSGPKLDMNTLKPVTSVDTPSAQTTHRLRHVSTTDTLTRHAEPTIHEAQIRGVARDEKKEAKHEEKAQEDGKSIDEQGVISVEELTAYTASYVKRQPVENFGGAGRIYDNDEVWKEIVKNNGMDQKGSGTKKLLGVHASKASLNLDSKLTDEDKKKEIIKFVDTCLQDVNWSEINAGKNLDYIQRQYVFLALRKMDPPISINTQRAVQGVAETHIKKLNLQRGDEEAEVKVQGTPSGSGVNRAVDSKTERESEQQEVHSAIDLDKIIANLKEKEEDEKLSPFEKLICEQHRVYLEMIKAQLSSLSPDTDQERINEMMTNAKAVENFHDDNKSDSPIRLIRAKIAQVKELHLEDEEKQMEEFFAYIFNDNVFKGKDKYLMKDLVLEKKEFYWKKIYEGNKKITKIWSDYAEIMHNKTSVKRTNIATHLVGVAEKWIYRPGEKEMLVAAKKPQSEQFEDKSEFDAKKLEPQINEESKESKRSSFGMLLRQSVAEFKSRLPKKAARLEDADAAADDDELKTLEQEYQRMRATFNDPSVSSRLLRRSPVTEQPSIIQWNNLRIRIQEFNKRLLRDSKDGSFVGKTRKLLTDVERYHDVNTDKLMQAVVTDYFDDAKKMDKKFADALDDHLLKKVCAGNSTHAKQFIYALFALGMGNQGARSEQLMEIVGKENVEQFNARYNLNIAATTNPFPVPQSKVYQYLVAHQPFGAETENVLRKIDSIKEQQFAELQDICLNILAGNSTEMAATSAGQKDKLVDCYFVLRMPLPVWMTQEKLIIYMLAFNKKIVDSVSIAESEGRDSPFFNPHVLERLGGSFDEAMINIRRVAGGKAELLENVNKLEGILRKKYITQKANHDLKNAEVKVAHGVEALHNLADQKMLEKKINYDEQGVALVYFSETELTPEIRAQFPNELKHGIVVALWQRDFIQAPPIRFMILEKVRSMSAAVGLSDDEIESRVKYWDDYSQSELARIKQGCTNEDGVIDEKRFAEAGVNLMQRVYNEELRYLHDKRGSEHKSQTLEEFAKQLNKTSAHVRSSQRAMLSFNPVSHHFSFDDGAEVAAHARHLGDRAANLSLVVEGSYQDSKEAGIEAKVTSSIIKHTTPVAIDEIVHKKYFWQKKENKTAILVDSYLKTCEIAEMQARWRLHGREDKKDDSPCTVDWSYQLLTSNMGNWEKEWQTYGYVVQAAHLLDGTMLAGAVPTQVNMSVMNAGTKRSIGLAVSKDRSWCLGERDWYDSTQTRENRKAYIHLEEASRPITIPADLDKKFADPIRVLNLRCVNDDLLLMNQYKAIRKGMQDKRYTLIDPDTKEEHKGITFYELAKEYQGLQVQIADVKAAIQSHQEQKDLDKLQELNGQLHRLERQFASVEKLINEHVVFVAVEHRKLDKVSLKIKKARKERWRTDERKVNDAIRALQGPDFTQYIQQQMADPLTRDNAVNLLLDLAENVFKARMDALYYSNDYRRNQRNIILFNAYSSAYQRLAGMLATIGCKSANDRTYIARLVLAALTARDLSKVPIPPDLVGNPEEYQKLVRIMSRDAMTNTAGFSVAQDTSGGGPKASVSFGSGFRILKNVFNVGYFHLMSKFAPHKLKGKMKKQKQDAASELKASDKKYEGHGPEFEPSLAHDSKEHNQKPEDGVEDGFDEAILDEDKGFEDVPDAAHGKEKAPVLDRFDFEGVDRRDYDHKRYDDDDDEKRRASVSVTPPAPVKDADFNDQEMPVLEGLPDDARLEDEKEQRTEEKKGAQKNWDEEHPEFKKDHKAAVRDEKEKEKQGSLISELENVDDKKKQVASVSAPKKDQQQHDNAKSKFIEKPVIIDDWFSKFKLVPVSLADQPDASPKTYNLIHAERKIVSKDRNVGQWQRLMQMQMSAEQGMRVAGNDEVKSFNGLFAKDMAIITVPCMGKELQFVERHTDAGYYDSTPKQVSISEQERLLLADAQVCATIAAVKGKVPEPIEIEIKLGTSPEMVHAYAAAIRFYNKLQPGLLKINNKSNYSLPDLLQWTQLEDRLGKAQQAADAAPVSILDRSPQPRPPSVQAAHADEKDAKQKAKLAEDKAQELEIKVASRLDDRKSEIVEGAVHELHDRQLREHEPPPPARKRKKKSDAKADDSARGLEMKVGRRFEKNKSEILAGAARELRERKSQEHAAEQPKKGFFQKVAGYILGTTPASFEPHPEHKRSSTTVMAKSGIMPIKENALQVKLRSLEHDLKHDESKGLSRKDKLEKRKKFLEEDELIKSFIRKNPELGKDPQVMRVQSDLAHKISELSHDIDEPAHPLNPMVDVADRKGQEDYRPGLFYHHDE